MPSHFFLKNTWPLHFFSKNTCPLHFFLKNTWPSHFYFVIWISNKSLPQPKRILMSPLLPLSFPNQKKNPPLFSVFESVCTSDRVFSLIENVCSTFLCMKHLKLNVKKQLNITRRESIIVSWWPRAMKIRHSGGILQQTATLADRRPAHFRGVGYDRNLVSTYSLEILREYLDHKWHELTLRPEGVEPSYSPS